LSESDRGSRGFGSSDYPVDKTLEEIDYLPEEQSDDQQEDYDEELNSNEEEVNEIQSRW
jgi:hypothetical protein